MQEQDANRRLGELEKRLAEIERRLGIAQVPETPPPLPVVAPPPATRVVPPHIHSEPLPVQPVPVIASPKLDYQQPAMVAPPKSAPAKTISHGSLEQTIGLKWTGWIGAVVLLVGAGLGVRFAYEQGWFGRVSYTAWLTFIFAVGFALIGLGEWVYRKVNRISAASIFGAGVATLFLAGYAGHAYYRLYDQSVAYALMAAATLLGAAVAKRGNLLSIAVLAIVGGNITPLVIRADHPNLPGFLGYLATLQMIAMLLAYFGGHPKWWALRGLSLATTAAWVVLAAMGNMGEPTPSVMLIAGIWFALVYHLELLATTARDGAAAPWQAGAGFSLCVSAALAALALWVIPQDQVAERITFIALEAVVTALMGLLVSKHRALSSSYVLQTLGLITVVIPIALSGDSIILGWAALAVGMAIVGRWPKQTISRAWASVVFMLAMGFWAFRLQTLPDDAPFHAAIFTILQTPLTHGLFVGFIVSICGQIVAWLTMPNNSAPDSAKWSRLAWLTTVLAAGLWIADAIAQLPPTGATLAIIALAYLAAIADALSTRMRYVLQSAALLMIAMVKWAAVDALAERLSQHWVPDVHPLFNPIAGIGLLLAVSFLAIYFLRRSSIHFWIAKSLGAGRQVDFAFALACVVIGLLAFNFCFQIDDLIQLAAHNGATLPWPAEQLEQLSITLILCATAAALWLAAAWADRRAQSSSRTHGIAVMAMFLPAKFVLADTFLQSLNIGATATPMLNLMTLTAAVLAALMIGTSIFSAKDWHLQPPTPGAVARAIFVLGWGGSFELTRLIQLHILPGSAVWPQAQLILICLTTLWTAGGITMYLLAPRSRGNGPTIRFYRAAAAAGLILLSMKYLLLDTLVFRFAFASVPAVMPVFNPQFIAGLILAIALGIVCLQHVRPSNLPMTAGFFMMLTLLVGGSLEVDRFFATWLTPGTFADPDLARQVALSIFWSIFAVAAVAGGFRFRAPALRYFGLALFAVTLLKVVLVDMEQVSAGYRFLSFLGLGGLLMGTSVLYGKIGASLHGELRHVNGG